MSRLHLHVSKGKCSKRDDNKRVIKGKQEVVQKDTATPVILIDDDAVLTPTVSDQWVSATYL